MSIASHHHYQVDLSKGVQVTPMGHLLFTGDKYGDVYHVKVLDGGKAVDLSGAAVNAYMLRSDHVTVTLTGKVENGEAVVTLDAACYAVTGRAVLVIKMAQGESITTIFAVECAVMRSSSDTIADPGGVIPSLEELLAQIALIEQATASATAAAASANAVANEVESKLQSGELNGPPGKDGPQGAPGAPGVSITGVSIETGGVEPGGGGEQVQSDWNQKDSAAPDFIRNKPFGEAESVLVEEQTLVFDADEGAANLVLANDITAGAIVKVKWNGNIYKCVAEEMEDFVFFGNKAALGGEDTGEPFACATTMGYGQIIPLDGSENATVEIVAEVTKKLENKYVELCSVFYAEPSDPYLYTDRAMTNKATKMDVREAAQAGPIVIYEPFERLWFTPVTINFATGDSAYVVITHLSGGDNITNKILHTAEYVPET